MQENNAHVLLEAGTALGTPKSPSSPTDYILVPQGFSALATERLIEPYLDSPRRLKAHIHTFTVESFINYVEQFKTAATRIFADPALAQFTAILDYHESDVEPAWCEHKVEYLAKPTVEWTRWCEQDNVHMNQVQLAEFLEDLQNIIVDPPGAELLELVQTLEGSNEIRCNSMVRLSNGRARLLYEEDVELKGTVSTKQGEVEFPQNITVLVPPFEDGPAYKVICRLRYRITNRRLEFWFQAVDVHLVIKDAVQQIVGLIEAKLGVKPLMGVAK